MDSLKHLKENNPLNKNREYSSEGYISLQEIKTWPYYYACNESTIKKNYYSGISESIQADSKQYDVNERINEKISIVMGSIVTLDIDAIVNAANNQLRGGGGVDGAIHRAAGEKLLQECQSLDGCKTGYSVITNGYQLKAKHVIHTVGPTDRNENMLKSCYSSCLKLALDNQIKTIAFPCIATGVYNYPNEAASKVALKTTRDILEKDYHHFERIIFCLFMPEDINAYMKHLPQFFPLF